MSILTIAYLLPLVALAFMLWVLLTGDIRKTKEGRYFRLFLFNLIIWLGFLWIADLLNSNDSLMFLKLALCAGSFAPLTFFVFCQQFSGKLNRIATSVTALASLLFAMLSLSNLLVVSVESGEIGIKIEDATALYSLQTVYTILAFGASFVWLRIKARKSDDARVINQVRFITYGAILALAVGVIGGSINASGTNLLSPLAITIFAATGFLAIFRHGLFDIRLVVARSIAYLLTLGIITAIFIFFVFGFYGAVLESHFTKTVQQMFYVSVTLLLVLTYLPLKRFFDKLTNSLFYQDAYDPQKLLDELNASLVTTIEIDEMLSLASRIIAKHIKTGLCSFVLKPKKGEAIRILGHHLNLEENEVEPLTTLINTYRHKVVFASNLPSSHAKHLEVMQKHSIMGVSRLATRSGVIGYMLLGDKKSGNLYSTHDSQIIEIISDELAIAVQNALRFEEIQKFNITLQEKIEEATKQLRHANHRLKELDATKDEFISMASHQLRTPLTAIKGYLSMVLEGDMGAVPKKQRDMLQQSFDSAERMVFLIADLLNVSRLQSGKFVIENKPTDLAKMIEAEIAQLQETAKNHHLSLTYKKPSSFPVLNLDETKIRQVIMNFLDNAIYYTPAGGSITVALEATASSVSYTVTDTGLGVPKQEQHHLFNKFYRAGNARKMRPDGTGLGLFMAKKVIVAQGGAIIFKSEEGKGSTFGFSFPRHTMEIKTAATPKKPEKETVAA